jgi:hypothetical protein
MSRKRFSEAVMTGFLWRLRADIRQRVPARQLSGTHGSARVNDEERQCQWSQLVGWLLHSSDDLTEVASETT